MADEIIVKDGVGIFVKDLGVRLPSTVERAVLAAAQYAAGVIRKTTREIFPSGRTGALARSFRETFLGWSDGAVSAAAVSDLTQAGILDRGGVITAKSGRNLAVPVGAGRALPAGKWPRDFAKGELTLIGRKGRPPLLARVSGRKVTPLFILKPSVKIRGRHYLEAARETAASGVADIVAGGVSEAIDKAGR